MENEATQQIDSTGTAPGVPFAEVEILWITAGLGCDGDTIAMTAATQPSLEDLLFGTFPWIPKVKLHNPFLAYENGDEFLKPFHLAAAGKFQNPYILVIEGSIPNEKTRARVTGPPWVRTRRPASQSSRATGLIGWLRMPGR